MGLNEWTDNPQDCHENSEPDWYEYSAFVLAETDKAVGFGSECPGEVELWLPKSQLAGITYDDEGGDSDDILIGEGISAVCIPHWLAVAKEID